MSEDEEILFKGKDLYTHLVNQGYTDFETFNPILPDIKGFESLHIAFKSTDITSAENLFKSNLKKCATISSDDFEQLDIVLKSRLLFKEDAELIETALGNCFIYKVRSKWFWYISTFGSFISSLAMCRKTFKFYLPCGFTILLAAYSLWKSCNETIMARKRKEFRGHIELLQSMCSDIQKLLRFLKETEILSGGQFKSQNVGDAIYSPHGREVKKLGVLPSWKPLLCIRKCLLDSLIEVINSLVVACNLLKEISPDIADFNVPLSGTRNVHAKTDPDQNISLKELLELDETYLSLQSEYLKLISICVCPKLWDNSLTVKENSLDVYKFCQSLKSKFMNISFRLKMQYDLQSIYSSTHRSVATRSFKVDSNEINIMQIEVHNIFLLMLSMLLRVRNVEDYLENIPKQILNENQNEIKASVSKQFMTLKDDLASTLKCFDQIYRQVGSEIKNHDIQTKSGKGNEDVTSANSKPTGIIVGSSDFNVNSPDEVFLAISGVNVEEQEFVDDDWFSEKKPQIPINLLSELSNRLKMRKKCFIEREKAALERQGLLDISDKHGENSSSNEEIDENFSTVKNKTIVERSSDTSDSSDNEERFVSNIPYQRRKQIKIFKVDSDSEGSLADDERIFNDSCMGKNLHGINEQSVANLAAVKSKLWRNMSEECFSDG